MRIGQEKGYLLIERREPSDGGSPCRAEAAAVGPGCRFTAVCEELSLDTSAEARHQFSLFEGLRARRVEIKLSDGGWLRLRRAGSGALVVHYRLGRWGLGAAAEGEVAVAGESARDFCRELGSLLAEPG